MIRLQVSHLCAQTTECCSLSQPLTAAGARSQPLPFPTTEERP
jgi:hypothetical protein